MTNKQVGKGAGRFSPDSQFGINLNKINELPATPLEATPNIPAKTEAGVPTSAAKPIVKANRKSSSGFQSNEFKRSLENKESRITAYNLDINLTRKLKIYAAENQVSASKIVSDLIEGFLAKQQKKQTPE